MRKTSRRAAAILVATVGLVTAVLGPAGAGEDRGTSERDPSLRTSLPVYGAGDSITVEFSGFPGNDKDWITLIESSQPANLYGSWAYTHCRRSGGMDFRGLPPGDYQARAYFNWPDGGYTIRAVSSFRVIERNDADTSSEKNVGDYYWNLGVAHFDKGEYPQARENLRRALELYRHGRGESHPLIASTLNQMARVYLAEGDDARARECDEKALSIWTEAGMTFQIALARNGLASADEARGDLASALENYRIALDLWKKSAGPEHVNVGVALFGMAGILEQQGRDREALDDYRRAVEIWVKEWGENHENVARARLTMGWIAYRLGDVDSALRDFRRALESRRMIYGDNHPDIAQALEAIGTMDLGKGDIAAAIASFREGLDALRLLGDRWDGRPATLRPIPQTVNLLWSLSRAEAAAPDSPRRDRLRRALATAETALDVLVRLRSGLSESARQFQEKLFRDLPAYVLGLQKELMQLGEEPVPARVLRAAEMASAWSFLEMMAEARADASGALPDTLAGEERDILSRIRFLDERAGASGVERLAMENRLDLFVDRLYREAPRYAALRYPRPAALEDLRRTLEPDELALEYVVSDRAAFLVAVSRDSFLFAPLAEGDALDSVVRAARRAILDGTPAVGPLSRLHDLLLEPVASLLTRKKLVIVPSGSLEGIAFESLQDRDGRWLSEKNEIAYQPSLAIFSLLRDLGRDRKPTCRLLALGNPIYDTTFLARAARGSSVTRTAFRYSDSMRASWGPLPGTALEVAAVSSLFPAGDVTRLLGSAATEEEVRTKDWNEYGFLHFACHGALEEGPGRQPALVFSMAGNREPYDGFLTMSEIMAKPHRVRLAVLSACQTGLASQSAPRSGVSSLARAFLLSGSEAVVVSLWPVSDEATARLMAEFYRLMREKNLPPVEALHAAQAALRADPRFAHPAYWAPFVVVGS